MPVRIARSPVLIGTLAVGLMGTGFLASRMLTDDKGETPLVIAPPGPAATTTDSQAAAITRPPAPTVESNENGATPAPRPERALSASTTQRPPDSGSTRPTPGSNRQQQQVAEQPRINPPATVESSRVQPEQKPDSLPTVPTLTAPPPASSASGEPAASPRVSTPVTTPAEEVTAVIQAYARALAGANLDAARRIYPTMPNDQRQGLEALWRGGGSMSPTWTVSDIRVDDNVATAVVRGTNMVVAIRGETPQQVPVSLRARLEKRNNEWRLVALVN